MATQHALCAKAIKAELKAKYPMAIIRVSSQSFSMGNSVGVRVNGIAESDKVWIEAICGKYQYGHFNGMEDIYEHSNNSDNLPQAKYVQVSFHKI